MQKKKILFILALLLTAVTQGAWAQNFDKWDGVSETEPGFVRARTSYGIVLQINTAAELAWVMRHPGKSINYYNEWAGSDCITSANSDCIDINGNFDMTAANWAPISYRNGPNKKIIFNGKGHTIKIKIDSNTNENGQGLFKEIASNCSVENLHLDCYIKVNNARMVGGIVGDNYGTVENCYVTGHVESNHYSTLDADLGGIAGLNEGTIKYCCVSGMVKNTDKNYGVGGIAGSNEGTIEHVTFYGTVSVDHSQDNTWVGDQDKTLNNNYTSFNQSEYNDSSGKDMYRSAIKYPYAINVTTAGPGSIKFSIEGEENAPGARDGQTVTVTKTSGNAVVSFSVKNDDGNDVSVSGNEANGWTFSMPKSKVEINAVFANDDGSLPIASTTRQLEDGKTYKVTEDVTLDGRLWVIGTVRLILGESATLNARRGIEVRNAHKANLTIDGPGTLNINNCYDGDAGIGSTEVGTLTINGGTINVKGGRLAAAIGGSQNNTTGGTITINGGIINATGGDEAAGIGGGYNSFGWFDNYGVCGDITINGGQVTAKGGRAYLMSGDYAAGIGPGNSNMGMGSQKSGTLTLSWTNMSDFVYIDKLKNGRGATLKSITFADGKQFVQEGTSTFATADNIEGKKIVPYFTISGAGTEADPYTIGSADDWNAFANYVNNGGMSFEGQFVKLTNNISVETMVGTSYANSFQGTFDGGGHTLTVNYNSSENNAAPFSHVSNATIKNLRVAGSITTSAPFAGGIVSESHGALTLSGCVSSVAINSSKSGDGTHGGLVSTLSGKDNAIIIEGCVFDGSFASTTGTVGCGGFIGWGVYNKPVIRNSLLKPSSVGANMLGSNFARWHTGDGGIYEPTFTDCYYVATDNLPTDQGTQVYAVTNVPANLGNLVQNYGMVAVYQNGILFDGKYYVAPATISLADNADNNDAISNANGYVADVTLANRTLYKDGAWNTICLPFDVVLEGSALEGATARPLTAASISGTTLNLTFGDAVTTLTAGTPYIIKWESGNNIVSPVFYGVTIDKTDRSYDNGQSGDIRVRFLGTYKSTAFDSENKSILLMGGENTLYYPTSGAGIGAQRAYFKIGSDAALARRLTSFNIDFGGDDETTGIIELKNSRIEELNSVDAWFSLDGRKLDGKPTRAGLYINKGNIVVIKQ